LAAGLAAGFLAIEKSSSSSSNKVPFGLAAGLVAFLTGAGKSSA